MSVGERYPRKARLRNSREIRAVVREGRRNRSGPVEVFVRRSPAERPRVGIVVPTYDRRIVDRNRLRRRLREILRRDWLPEAVESGLEADVVVRARSGAYDLDFSSLRSALLEALDKFPWFNDSSSG